MGRLLIVTGLVLVLLGILVNALPGTGASFWGKLPGNVEIRGKNWTFFSPVGFCIAVSVAGSLILWLFSKR
jgi:hypothetical protein